MDSPARKVEAFENRGFYVREHPILKVLQPRLRNRNGIRMRHWGRIAFAVELMQIGIPLIKIAKAAQLGMRRCRELRAVALELQLVQGMPPNPGHTNILRGPKVTEEEIKRARQLRHLPQLEAAAKMGITKRRVKHLRALAKAAG